MKISYIAAVALSGAFLSTAPAAYAGCGNNVTCNSGSSYGSGYNSAYTTSYGSSYGSSSHSMGAPANCPSGTSPSNDGTCLVNGGSSTYMGSSSSNYSSGTSYAMSSSMLGAANCPSGTSRSHDGTCLMFDGGSTYMGSSTPSYSSRTYSGSSTSTYTPSTSYSSSYGSTGTCPAGSSRSSDGVCMVSGGSSSYTGSSSYSYSSTPLNSYRGQSSYSSNDTITVMSDSEADRRYGSGSISGPYTDGSNTIVPFTTTSTSVSNYRVPGMGANEFLSPTNCPVNVYNPGGAKVLGCYQVSKPAPVRVSVPNYHTVRVVRPIIYVRYPVPTPIYNTGVRACGAHHNWNTHHAQRWSGRCGW